MLFLRVHEVRRQSSSPPRPPSSVAIMENTGQFLADLENYRTDLSGREAQEQIDWLDQVRA